MVKVFTSGESPESAGTALTNKINEWIQSHEREIEILNIHTNSNKWGWMIIIHYKTK